MSATPRTIAVPLHPNQATASYSLASGLAQFVESVYIEVDGTGAGDMSPLLTFSEQSGVVIGKKRQGDSITGGTSGSATWALRLTDERRRGRFGGGGTASYAGNVVSPGSGGGGIFTWTQTHGAVLLNNTGGNAQLPLVLYPGVYAVCVSAIAQGSFPGEFGNVTCDINRAVSPSGFASQDFPLHGVDVTLTQPSGFVALTLACSPGDSFDVFVDQTNAIPVTFAVYVTVQRWELP